MRTRSKLLLTALTSAFVLAAAVGTSSARNLSISDQGFRAVWTSLSFTPLGGIIRAVCNATLSGSFHYRTLAKTRSLVGYVTEAAITRPCRPDEAWILNGTERLPEGATTANTLPWHVVYDSFRGTLPVISGVRVAIIGFQIRVTSRAGSMNCLYSSTATSPMFGIVNLNSTTGAAANLQVDEITSVPLRERIEGVFPCPVNGRFAGTTTAFTPASGEGTITIRLI
jgi:hypothetical protein